MVLAKSYACWAAAVVRLWSRGDHKAAEQAQSALGAFQRRDHGTDAW